MREKVQCLLAKASGGVALPHACALRQPICLCGAVVRVDVAEPGKGPGACAQRTRGTPCR